VNDPGGKHTPGCRHPGLFRFRHQFARRVGLTPFDEVASPRAASVPSASAVTASTTSPTQRPPNRHFPGRRLAPSIPAFFFAARRPDGIVRSPLSDAKGAEWLAARTGLPVIELPQTVGATADAGSLPALFDAIVNRLSQAR